jgi:hypothetical protein
MKVQKLASLLIGLLCLFVLIGCRQDGSDTDGSNSVNTAPESVESEEPVAMRNDFGSQGVMPLGYQAAQSLPAPLILPAPTGPNFVIGSSVSHVVEPYEWLHQITRCYGAEYAEVLRVNKDSIHNPDLIYPNDVVILREIGKEGPIIGPRCVKSHWVAPGETFYGLARLYQTTPEILQLANPGPLLAGNEIVVPATTPENVSPPSLRQSLVFNLDGDLAVWRQVDAGIEVYIDNDAYILDLVTHENGRFVLTKQTRDQGTTVEIALIDRTTRTETIIETGLSPEELDESIQFRSNMLIAPNGAWAAYLVRENGTMRLSTFATSNTADVRQVTGIPHGLLEGGTPQLFAGGDDMHFLMLDNTGIYEYPYALDESEKQLVTIDKNMASSPLVYEAISWSPTSGHLLLEGIFSKDVRQHYLMDKNSGATKLLSNSTINEISADATWLKNGQIAVLTPPFANEAGPILTVYRPESTPTTLSVVEVSKNVLSISGHSRPQSGYTISAPPIQPVPNTVDFTLVGAGAASGYWTAEVGSSEAGRLNYVPANGDSNVWTTDDGGLLMQQGGGDRPWELLYVPVQGTAWFSLTSWLGIRISHFNWVVR